MPFALATIGLLLVVVGFQDTYKQFGEQLAKDFTGDHNFIYWMIALGLVGSVGYIQGLEKFSRLFLALIIVSMLLADKGQQGIGFFKGFNDAVKQGSNTAVNPIGGNAPVSAAGGGGSHGASGSWGDVGSFVSTAATIASFF